MAKVTFNGEWYQALITKSDEKQVLLAAFQDIISQGNFHSCLEIGLGTAAFFPEHLAKAFETYAIVEREKINVDLPENATLIHSDWEHASLGQKYDVILASHVIYYFDDKAAAIQKMYDSLNPGGIIIFVVNGKDADYGPMKLAFAELVQEEYQFTYDEIKRLLASREYQEISVPSTIAFDNTEDLFESLFLSFDAYPSQYIEYKKELIHYFDRAVKNGTFVVNQKIFVCKK